MNYLFILLLAFSFSFAQGATPIYKKVGPNGSVTFTDKPPVEPGRARSEEINLPNVSQPEQGIKQYQQLKQSGVKVGEQLNNFKQLHQERQQAVRQAMTELTAAKAELKQAERELNELGFLPPQSTNVYMRNKIAAQQIRVAQLKKQVSQKEQALLKSQHRLRDLRLDLNKPSGVTGN